MSQYNPDPFETKRSHRPPPPQVDELGYQLDLGGSHHRSSSSIYDNPDQGEFDEYFDMADVESRQDLMENELNEPDPSLIGFEDSFGFSSPSPSSSTVKSRSGISSAARPPHSSHQQPGATHRYAPPPQPDFTRSSSLVRTSTELPPLRPSQTNLPRSTAPLVRPNPIRPMPVSRQQATQPVSSSYPRYSNQVQPQPSRFPLPANGNTSRRQDIARRPSAHAVGAPYQAMIDGTSKTARITELEKEAEYWGQDEGFESAINSTMATDEPFRQSSIDSSTTSRPSVNSTFQGYASTQQYQSRAAIPSTTTPVQSSRVAPSTKRGIRLKPVNELPDTFRSIWRFGVFNAVQSVCFDSMYMSDENVVVSAPTGAGKTVLFELAIIRLFTTSTSSNSKVLYMAPTKSLCAERTADWKKKFEIALGWSVKELTGDSEIGSGTWREVASARIIVTTPEKWDSLTRRWHDHDQILAELKLFCIDEVHFVGTDVRGAVLEVVVSRMRTLGTSTRFVAVSATVPNVVDIAEWLKSHDTSQPATVFEFGDDFRPCPLQKVVIGYPRNNSNEFAFANNLNFRLFDVIKQYSSGKPVLVFCLTRKGCLEAAEQLVKDFNAASTSRGVRTKLAWPKPPRATYAVNDKRLATLIESGVAIHHAGMEQNDRKLVEKLFVEGRISIVCSTSTLAVGVNLPARMVIIKGTKTFRDNRLADYLDLEILQMIGRAGRPQFDNIGIACILTDKDSRSRYENLVNAQRKLESCLHQNLTEHINAEINLQTISDIDTALHWLRSTFLYVRIAKNPSFYAIANGSTSSPDARLEEICVEAINQLVKEGIVTQNEDGTLAANDFGDIMSRYSISHPTFVNLKTIPLGATMREKATLTKFNKNLRFPTTSITTAGDRVMIIIQLVLEGIPGQDVKTDNSNPLLDVGAIWSPAIRIAKAMVNLATIRRDASARFAMELLRSLNGRCWDGTSFVLRQLNGIGEKSYKALVDAGIRSFSDVSCSSPDRLELILNRKPPFGSNLAKQARSFPTFELTLEIDREEIRDDGVEVQVTVGVQLKRTKPPPITKKGIIRLYANILLYTNDNHFIEFRSCPLEALLSGSKDFSVSVVLVKPSQRIFVSASCDTLAGSEVRAEVKPQAKASQFPIPSLASDPDAKDDQALIVQALPNKPKKTIDAKSSLKRSAPVEIEEDEENEDAVDVEPRRRDDGKFECNHVCGDKTKCKHLCCREGLDKPPRSKPKTTLSNKKRKLSVNQSGRSKSKSIESVAPPPTKKRLPVQPSQGIQLMKDAGGKTVTTSASSSSSAKKRSMVESGGGESDDDDDDRFDLPTPDELASGAFPGSKSNKKKQAKARARKIVIGTTRPRFDPLADDDNDDLFGPPSSSSKPPPPAAQKKKQYQRSMLVNSKRIEPVSLDLNAFASSSSSSPSPPLPSPAPSPSASIRLNNRGEVDESLSRRRRDEGFGFVDTSDNEDEGGRKERGKATFDDLASFHPEDEIDRRMVSVGTEDDLHHHRGEEEEDAVVVEEKAGEGDQLDEIEVEQVEGKEEKEEVDEFEQWLAENVVIVD